ncbi:MAG: 50S ribosomal protein L29 [Proteobacteria bacterium]|nr:50S ribosomal protein L29 [Pseudomonadota bacterium]
MKASELRDLSVEELNEREREVKEELFNLQFQHATNQLENAMRIPQTKKDVARIKTVIRQKERAQARSEG